ncbi:MAG: family 16 glycosylhydrolase [Breznakibacter sp.]
MKRTFITFAFTFFIFGVATAQYDGYQLVWSDEFEGPSLNPGNWTCETGRGSGGWGTGQLDYATDSPNNVLVEDGMLKLTLRDDGAPDNSPAKPYTSGRLTSYGKRSFTYGRIEARIKALHSQGLGFAFWLLGDNYQTLYWPKCGEIDIAEITGKTPSYNIGTMHYSNGGSHAQSQGSFTLPDGQRFANDFHVFSIEWTPNYIQFAIDGQNYYKRWIINSIDYDPFHKPFFIILSTGVGGTYSGLPDATSVFPMTVEIDWVRVYQQTLTSTDRHTPANAGTIKVVPNPVSSVAIIELPVKNHRIKSAQLFDSQGRLIMSLGNDTFTDGKATIDLNKFPQGTYLFKTITDQRVFSCHILKK